LANRFQIGAIEILALSDGTATLPSGYMRGTNAAQWEPHKRWLDHNGNLVMPLGCFLVRAAGELVLIDTGTGPMDSGGFKGGALLDDLAGEGVSAEDVSQVFITHLHFDHVGWAARQSDGGMTPTFPNASYRWTSAEQEAWRDTPASGFVRQDIFAAVAPRWQAADGGVQIAEGIDVVPLPGHTPGHAGVVVSSGQKRAFILGDAISCPVQLEEPEWSGLGDMDPGLARKTQDALAREIEGSARLIGASHFPGLSFGRVLRGEGKRYWQVA
jgi:glyoxylase-like metal-dependent hydrolase (beta-lactamase superfamily II)